jgi:uncharacterized membrane protein YbhN (UPF0104 family)
MHHVTEHSQETPHSAPSKSRDVLTGSPANSDGPASRKRLLSWLKVTAGSAIVLVSFYFLASRLIRDWHQIPFTRLSVSPLRLAVAFSILLLLHFPLYGWLWRTILAALGAHVGVPKATAISAVSAIGKYAPGKVWFTLGRMSLAKLEGVAEDKTLLSVVLEIAFTLLAGLMLLGVAVLLLPRSQVPAVVYSLFILAPLCLGVLYPPVLNRVLGVALKWFRRPPFELRLSYGRLLAILGICLLDWLAQGVGCFVLIGSFCRLDAAKLPVLLGGYAISWMIGFLVLVSPAGLGIREGVFTLVLKTVVPEPVAIIAAVVTRAWMTMGELAAALVGFVFLRIASRRRNA